MRVSYIGNCFKKAAEGGTTTPHRTALPHRNDCTGMEAGQSRAAVVPQPILGNHGVNEMEARQPDERRQLVYSALISVVLCSRAAPLGQVLVLAMVQPPRRLAVGDGPLLTRMHGSGEVRPGLQWGAPVCVP